MLVFLLTACLSLVCHTAEAFLKGPLSDAGTHHFYLRAGRFHGQGAGLWVEAFCSQSYLRPTQVPARSLTLIAKPA